MDEQSKIKMGIFAERSHRIIEVDDCKIQNQKCQKIANDIYKFLKENNISGYNETVSKGLVRHIIIRIGIKTDEIMVIVVLNSLQFPKEKKFIDYLVSNNPEIKTIVKNLNNKNTNVILGNETDVIYGEGYIFDYIGNKKFKISPHSFFQVNPVQTEKLYNKAIEYASLSGKETVFDLYCGIGTIGIYASDRVKELYGVEVVEDAIKDAKENAKLNNIKNAKFLLGKSEEVIQKLINKNIIPDIVFVDPPRRGCDKNLIQILLNIKTNKIIYISCNPATLARDLKILEEKYEIKKLAICDMFPGTRAYRKYCIIRTKIKYISKKT